MNRAACRMAVLISGRGSNLRALMESIHCGLLPDVELVVVGSNVPDAAGLKHAAASGIETVTVPHQDFPSRRAFDARLQQELVSRRIELVILAGFMRILSAEFVNFWHGRMMNIHPSLLPAYRGLNTHQRALDAGDRQAGASVHFVTPELDGGPVILQGIVDVDPADTEGTLAGRVLAMEHVIYPLAVRWVTEGRATLRENHCQLDGKMMDRPPYWYKDQLHWPDQSHEPNH